MHRPALERDATGDVADRIGIEETDLPRLHDGTISVASKVGVGTSVTLDLPV